MGFKKIAQSQLIANGVMTGTNLLTSASIPVQNLDNLGIQVSWTGTPIGDFFVNCSVDGVNFFALTFDPALGSASGSSGGFLISINQLPFPFVQFQYENVSGTGVLNALLFEKDLN